MKLVPVTYRIPEDLNERLAYAAIKRKTTRQAIVTEAIERLLDKLEADKSDEEEQ